MSNPLLQPILQDQNTHSGRWMVTIFDNDTNTVDQVEDVLMLATGCDAQEAAIETWEAHTFGKAPVHFASQSGCEEAARIISAIGVKTEVAPEWQD